jgi:hypothetical protein
MAVITHAGISAATVVEGVPVIKWVNPANTYYPGNVCVLTATKTATIADSDTAAHILMHPSILEFKPRVASTNARTSAEDAYAATDEVPMIMCGRRGPVKTVAKVDDQGAALFTNQRMIVSATGGTITVDATAHEETGMHLARDLADDDTYCLIWLY